MYHERVTEIHGEFSLSSVVDVIVRGRENGRFIESRVERGG